MTLEDRADLFGEPSDALAQEAVWYFRHEHGDWPLWDEAVTAVVGLALCDTGSAEQRLAAAVRDGEVVPRLRACFRLWGLEVDQAVSDRVERRVLDNTLKRSTEEVE